MLSLRTGSRELELREGDITTIPVDAIVNAANSQLMGGGGVDGAIHRAGGPEIMRELSILRARIGACPAGKAVATSAGRLPAKFVFHAVGPIYQTGDSGEPEALESCYRICLDMAAERNLRSLSFPSISTGVYQYPLSAAGQIALQTVWDWLSQHQGSVHLVKLVQFSAADHRVYCDLVRKRELSGVTAASS
jgi:O-acetyl-ADP-ribose deacetylase (regulator of RNase III)